MEGLQPKKVVKANANMMMMLLFLMAGD